MDYHSFTTQHATFVLINSETLIAPYLGLSGTTDPWVLNQTDAQWQWLEATLEQGAAESSHVIIMSHHPPFVTSPDEAHSYWNWPLGAGHAHT